MVLKLTHLATSFFPTAPFLPTTLAARISFRAVNVQETTKYTHSTLIIAGLLDAIRSGSGGRLVVCFSGGLGTMKGLLATFDEACYDAPFTLIVSFRFGKVDLSLRRIEEVSLAEWKVACETDGNLIFGLKRTTKSW
jgi:hypothetical protein